MKKNKIIRVVTFILLLLLVCSKIAANITKSAVLEVTTAGLFVISAVLIIITFCFEVRKK